LPEDIRNQIESQVTPSADAALSPIEVASQIDNDIQPVGVSESFILPVGRLFGAFSYNNMQDGVQWTAIWYLGEDIVCIESLPWDGGTGGYGYTECEQEEWVEGEYEIQMFIGNNWKVSTRFMILAEPLEPTTTPQTTATP
jgi:hypothetical protein